MTPLPFVALPQDEESFASTILRLVRGNGYSNVSQFLKNFGITPSDVPAHQWVGSDLYKLLLGQPALEEQDRDLLKSIFNIKFWRYRTDVFEKNGICLPANLLRKGLAICPECLKEGHLHHMHAFEFCDICPKHKLHYHLTCQKCNAPISWLDLKRSVCTCGQDLLQLPAIPADSYSTQLVVDALQRGDCVYYENLCTALKCSRYMEHPLRSHEALVECQNIATGDKSYFFSYMRKQQGRYPCLHRRAILAPWLLTDNILIRTFAIEYFFAASQQKPKTCPQDCDCSKLLFSPEEARFTFNTQNLSDIQVIHHKHAFSTTNGLLHISNICKNLRESQTAKWDTKDLQPFPSDANRLVNATEAALHLGTARKTIHRLHYFGLLKGEKFNRNIGILFPFSEINNFKNKYVLNREISKNLGIPPVTLQKLLTSAGIKQIRDRAFNSSLVVYLKDSIPPEFLSYLTTPQEVKDTRLQNSCRNGILFSEAAAKLRLDVKEIPFLIKTGILEAVPAIRKNGEPGRELCTRKGLHRALQWRGKLLTFLEVQQLTGCSCKLIHRRFISSNFAKEIKLSVTSLMTRHDAEKIKTHFKIYTTEMTARGEYRLGQNSIQRQILEDKIHPVPHCHKDYLKGQITILRKELDSIYRNIPEH